LIVFSVFFSFLTFDVFNFLVLSEPSPGIMTVFYLSSK